MLLLWDWLYRFEKLTFVATLLLLSDALEILGILKDAKQDCLTLHYRYACHLKLLMLEDLAIEDSFDKVRFKQHASAYINSIVTNLHNRFPQAKILSLLDCLDPKNIGTASRLNLMKLGDAMVIDGEQLWHEFLMYKSLPSPAWAEGTVLCLFVCLCVCVCVC